MKKIMFFIYIFSIISILTGCNNDTSNQSIEYGTLLDFKEVCLEFNEDTQCIKNGAILKIKIASKATNKFTIDQNYYNIENFIKKNDVEKYNKIDYWAVTDMSDGSEEKIISFTVNKDLINKIKNENVVANQLGNYVDNLYIHQSLK